MARPIRGIATADLHIGIDNVGGVDAHGLPVRVDDYFRAWDKAIMAAVEEKVDLFIVAGDLTRHRNPPQRIVAPFLYRLQHLVEHHITVVLDRGNHDGDSGDGWSNLLDTAGYIGGQGDVPVVAFNDPGSIVLALAQPAARLRVVGIPWPRISQADPRPLDELAEAADAALAETIGRCVAPAGPEDWANMAQILVGHIAVTGADRASDQWMTLGYEPMVTPAAFPANLDLVILGHYHKPSVVSRSGPPIIYCGSPIPIDFGEEGQEKCYWRFALDPDKPAGEKCVELDPVPIPSRPFLTIDVTLGAGVEDAGATQAVCKSLAYEGVQDAIVRVRVHCAASTQAAALNLAAVDGQLRDAGAWYVAGMTVEAPRAERRWGGDSLTGRPPEEVLQEYLARTEPDEDRRGRLHREALGLREGVSP